MAAIFCPYCNAQVDSPSSFGVGERVACSRCGEMIPVRSSNVIEADGPPPSFSFTAASPQVPSLTNQRPSKKLVVIFLVLAMLVSGIAALIIALRTQDIRRSHDYLPELPSFTLPLSLAPFLAVWILGLIVLLVLEFWKRRHRTLYQKGRVELFSRIIPFSVALIGWISLAVVAIALIALGLSRPRPKPTRPVPAIDRSEPLAPQQLSSLGFLPKDTELVAVLHVAELLKQTGGKEFLTEFRIGGTAISLDTIEQCTGVKAEEMDHATIGLKVAERVIPRLTLIVRTRQPYNLERIRANLKIGSSPKRGEKQLYRFKPEKAFFGMEADLWCPSDKLLIVGLAPTDLDEVPQMKAKGIDHLAKLRSCFTESQGTGAQAWLVGHADAWNHPVAKPLLAKRPLEEQQLLTDLKTLSLWLFFNEDVRLDARFDCVDEQATRRLAAHLVNQWKLDDKSVQVDGERVRVQHRLSRESLRRIKEPRITKRQRRNHESSFVPVCGGEGRGEGARNKLISDEQSPQPPLPQGERGVIASFDAKICERFPGSKRPIEFAFA